MGQIWAADHLALHRRVAVKCPSDLLADNAAALRRFAFEAQTLARLQTHHVPQVFDYATLSDGTPCIVMELLDGIELQTRLAANLPSLDETAQLIEQICAALSSVHALGIVHRDIKPGNIFLVRGEAGAFTAKLLDFGIAKSIAEIDSDDGMRMGSVLGTPNYMSPEQLAGAKGIDARTDIWSLGVVAYCCLTGQLPFPGDTVTAVWLSIHGGDLTCPGALRSDLPAEVDAWFRKALSRDPVDRFASAAEAARSFSIAAGAGLAARQTPLARRLQWRRADARLELVWLTTRTRALRPRRRRPPRATLRWLSAAAVVAAVAAFEPGWMPNGSPANYHAEEMARDPSRWIPSATPAPQVPCTGPHPVAPAPPMVHVQAPAEEPSSSGPLRLRPSQSKKAHSAQPESPPGADRALAH